MSGVGPLSLAAAACYLFVFIQAYLSPGVSPGMFAWSRCVAVVAGCEAFRRFPCTGGRRGTSAGRGQVPTFLPQRARTGSRSRRFEESFLAYVVGEALVVAGLKLGFFAFDSAVPPAVSWAKRGLRCLRSSSCFSMMMRWDTWVRCAAGGWRLLYFSSSWEVLSPGRSIWKKTTDSTIDS